MSQHDSSGSVMLEAVDLSKQYHHKLALERVGFQLMRGECLGIAGHNGSGKSTLLSLVAQTLIPDSGSILFEGNEVLGDRAFLRSHLGYIPQQDGLPEDLTVAETLRAWQALCNAPDDSAYDNAVKWMGLTELLRKRISALSGGMKKRVSIALALLSEPDILVMDEVNTALDQRYTQILREFLGAFTGKGGSVLYCSHQKEDLTRQCHRLLVLRRGRVVFYDRTCALPQDEAQCNSLFYTEQDGGYGEPIEKWSE